VELPRAELKDDEWKQLANLKLNGRQIKNAVACAVSIAVEEKTTLTLEGIQVILDMAVDEEDLEGGVVV
jgi:hypothetical protein